MIDFTYASIPPSILASIQRYVNEGVSPGHFVRAVLENNLYQAVTRADDESQAALCTIVAYVVNETPSAAWGSPHAVREWIVSWPERAADAVAMKALSDED